VKNWKSKSRIPKKLYMVVLLRCWGFESGGYKTVATKWWQQCCRYEAVATK